MVPWDVIRKFLLETCSAEEKNEHFFVSVRCPNDRLQTVCVYVVDSSKIVLESPFAKASEQASVLVPLLPLLAKVSHYGVRQDGDYLVLTNTGVLGGLTPPELDYLMNDLAAKADEIEDLLTEGEDSF